VASPDKKAFLLRLPPEVWSQLERLAAAELRSVNGQIEYLLREALARRAGSSNAQAPAEDTERQEHEKNGARRGARRSKR